MSVSLEEVIAGAGYNLEDPDDAKWLLAQKENFEELLEKADDLVDDFDDYEWFIITQEDEYDCYDNPSFEEWREARHKK